MPPPDVSSYRLSPEESRRIFEEQIVPIELGDVPPSPTNPPVAVLAVGQTGAGKTRLAPVLLSALRSVSREPAHFIADTYKSYHPAYQDLVHNQPHIASAATGPDARRWLAMAAAGASAADRRADVLIESACRHPDDFAQLARLFHEAGYRVEVAVLAVPAALSRLGVLARFYGKLPEAQSRGLPLRLTPTRVHDDSYQGLLEAARFLDAENVADQVVVVRRGNLAAYGEERGQEQQLAGGIAHAIETERQRPLADDELRMALEDVQTLRSHEQAAKQLEEVLALLQPLIREDYEKWSKQFPKLLPLRLGKDALDSLGIGSHLRLGIS